MRNVLFCPSTFAKKKLQSLVFFYLLHSHFDAQPSHIAAIAHDSGGGGELFEKFQQQKQKVVNPAAGGMGGKNSSKPIVDASLITNGSDLNGSLNKGIFFDHDTVSVYRILFNGSVILRIF